MPIQFNAIPSNIRVPFAYFEVNPGQSPYQTNARLLLLGQKTAAGSAVAEDPIMVTGGENGLFGHGSMMAAMYKAARLAAPFQEIWAASLDDLAGATKAVGRIAVEGAPISTAGTVVIYVGDIRVTVPVSRAMSNLSIAAALIAAINDCDGMQVLAAAGVAGIKATSAVTVTGPATSAGVASFTIDDTVYSVAVANGDTAAVIATNLATVVNNTSGANVTAVAVGSTVNLTAADTGVAPHSYTHSGSATATGVTVAVSAFAGGVQDDITLTANNAGTLGNSVGIYTRLYSDDGPLADQLLTITAMSGGAGDPSITAALANLGDMEFDWIVMPYAQTAYLNEMDTFLDARWGPMMQLYGHYVTAKDGTAGTLAAFASVRNGWHGTLLGTQNYPAPTYLIAASLGAVMAAHLQGAPELSRPLQTLPLPGFRGPKVKGDQWSIVQRQSFYYSGVSALKVERDGSLSIDRIISMYRLDAWGSPDQTWLDVNTQAQVMYGVRSLKQKVTSTYPRAALVDSNPNNLQGFATADDIRNVLVHGYRDLVDEGVFENAELFEAQLAVERNTSNPNRVDAYLPLDHVNQLRILAGNATSYLQYPAA